jgi:hypothetical protein
VRSAPVQCKFTSRTLFVAFSFNLEKKPSCAATQQLHGVRGAAGCRGAGGTHSPSTQPRCNWQPYIDSQIKLRPYGRSRFARSARISAHLPPCLPCSPPLQSWDPWLTLESVARLPLLLDCAVPAALLSRAPRFSWTGCALEALRLTDLQQLFWKQSAYSRTNWSAPW